MESVIDCPQNKPRKALANLYRHFRFDLAHRCLRHGVPHPETLQAFTDFAALTWRPTGESSCSLLRGKAVRPPVEDFLCCIAGRFFSRRPLVVRKLFALENRRGGIFSLKDGGLSRYDKSPHLLWKARYECLVNKYKGVSLHSLSTPSMVKE